MEGQEGLAAWVHPQARKVGWGAMHGGTGARGHGCLMPAAKTCLDVLLHAPGLACSQRPHVEDLLAKRHVAAASMSLITAYRCNTVHQSSCPGQLVDAHSNISTHCFLVEMMANST